MRLNISTIELVNRVRRALGIRGLTSIGVDDYCSLVVQAFDLDQAPFRTNGVAWFATRAQAAVAAQLSSVLINGTGTGGPQVVERLVISNENAASAVINIGYNGPVAGGAAANFAISGELPFQNQTPSSNIPISVTANAQVASLLTFNATGLFFPANTAISVDGPWVIPEGAQLVVEHGTLNSAIRVAARGRYYLPT